jgi:hypothetical protein
VFVTLAGGLALLQTPVPETPAQTQEGAALERFEVSRDLDLLLLPVKLGGKTYPFGLDSGSTTHSFDTSLPLGNPIEEADVSGQDGMVRLKAFAAPEAMLGGLSLKTAEPVIAFDFAHVRQVLGCEIRGMIGVPFFRRNIVRIDFDKGELLVLKEPGRDCGRAFAVRCDAGMLPLLRVDVGGDEKQEFILDTGWTGSVCLDGKLFETTRKKGALAVVGTELSETVNGTSKRRSGRLRQLSLDDLALPGLLATEGKANLLGLGFCSRFVITFDLPHDKVYLKRGKDFDRVDAPDLSGLHILRDRGRVLVHSVDRGSAAESAGIKAGDVLVQVDEARTEEVSLFRLRQGFCVKDKKLRLKVRRGEEETELVLALGREAGGEK